MLNLNVDDVVTVRSLVDIPSIPTYTSSRSDQYYSISYRTLADMSRPPNRYKIREVVKPAPRFDDAEEPVAYRLDAETDEIMEGPDITGNRRVLYFLGNMLAKVEDEEEIVAPDIALSDFLFGGDAK